MRLEECKRLKPGDKVSRSLGNGWRQSMTFIKMTEVTSFGTMTFNQLLEKDMDLSHGRKEQRALCEYVDDKGIVRQDYIRPRALRKEKKDEE